MPDNDTTGPATPGISAANLRRLAIALTNAFGNDRDARLVWLNEHIDREISSMNSLTDEEYEKVFDLARALPKAEHDSSPAPRRTAEEVAAPDGSTAVPVDELHPTEALPRYGTAGYAVVDVPVREQPEPPVQEAVRRIIHDIGLIGVGKTNQNREQGYSFRGIDDFVQKLSPLLAKHGVVILPRVTKHKITDFQTARRDGSMGALQQQAVLTVEWSVTGPRGDSLVAATVGQARDSADKASNKAMSAAFKYLLAQVFMVPNIGWDEQDFDSPEVASRAPRPGRGSTAPAPGEQGGGYTPPSDAEQQRAAAEQAALLSQIEGFAQAAGVPLEAFTEKFRNDHGGISMEQFQATPPPTALLRGWVRRIEAWNARQAAEPEPGQDPNAS